MRVLQVITDRDRRGAQVYALDLAAGLRSLGVDVSTCALIDGSHPSLDVETMGGGHLGLSGLRRLREAMQGADVAIAHGARTLPTCALAGMGIGTPIVYRQISDPRFWAGTATRRLRVALYLRRMSAIVSLAPDVADDFRSHYWLSAGMVSVIPNAVPEERFEPVTGQRRSAARYALGIDGSARVVVFVGALVPEKGCDLAIDAVVETDAILLVAGSGPESERLQDRAASAGARVRFLGSVEQMDAVYHSADAVVFPSRGGDSMPAALIEAALCGLPAVATRVGSIPSVITHDATGFIVEPGDRYALASSVVRLLGDDELRRAMGDAAREDARARYTIEATAPAWLRLLERVVGR